MNASTAAPAPLITLAHAVHGVFAAWRAISREQAALAAMLGLAAFAQFVPSPFMQSSVTLIRAAVTAQLGAFALLLAVVVADRAVDGGAPRRRAYGSAIVIAAAAGAVAHYMLLHLASQAFGGQGGTMQLLDENPRLVPAFLLSWMLEWLIIDALATYLYVDRREVRRIAERLHRAQVARIEQARRLVETQLQAMQARVEPRFLFDTLAHVKRLYGHDAGMAARMLDDLITYLRAAMPRMRDTSSTCAREVDLARAFLDIMKLRLNDRLDFAATVQEGLGDARLPPMVLLPLVDHALTQGSQLARGAGTLRIAVDARDGTLRVIITAGRETFAPHAASDAIASIRERLGALYGAHARLDLRVRDERTSEAVLEIPHEVIESGDR